jgi:hypothetical protein
MGDKSDNIPSVFKKCGIVTASKYYEDRDIVPIFIKNTNECIDMIYEDTREFHKAFNKFKDQRS